MKSGANVSLRVAKKGAIRHGLATLLSQPSLMVNKGKHGLNATHVVVAGVTLGAQFREFYRHIFLQVLEQFQLSLSNHQITSMKIRLCIFTS